MAVKHVTTTSTRLLYLVLYTGLLIFGLSIGVILYFLGRYFTSGIGVDGFTSQIVSIWFLGGLITLILGNTRNLHRQYHGGDEAAAVHDRAPYPPGEYRRRFGAECDQGCKAMRRAWTPAPSGERRRRSDDPVGGRGLLRLEARGARRDAAGRRLERSRFARTAAPAISSSARRQALTPPSSTLAAASATSCAFFARAGHRGRFIGYDIAPAMIEKARELHGEGDDRQWRIGAEPAETADFAIASGIFNVKGDVPNDALDPLRPPDHRYSRARGTARLCLQCAEHVERSGPAAAEPLLCRSRRDARPLPVALRDGRSPCCRITGFTNSPSWSVIATPSEHGGTSHPRA